MLVGLPGMKGASMLMPIAYLKQWSERMYLWGGQPNPDVRRIHYHPPRAGELNPAGAAGDWKPEPPDPVQDHGLDISKLSLAMQAELARQVDEKRTAEDAERPEPPRKPRARVGTMTRFNPNHHTVTKVLDHLRNASPAEVDRVLRLEENGSKRAGILKRRNQFGN